MIWCIPRKVSPSVSTRVSTSRSRIGFSFQLGLNQGFGTGGIQFKWPMYRISFTYYTEELGKEVGLDPHSYIVANAGLLF